MIKSTQNQQICVDLGTSMTAFTEVVTSCKNQHFGAYFLVDSGSAMTKPTKFKQNWNLIGYLEYSMVLLESFASILNFCRPLGIFWNLFGILNTTKYCK